MTVIGASATVTAASAASSSSSSGGVGFRGLASSALPSLGGDPLARPTWKRSLKELAASNLALVGGGGGIGIGNPATTTTTTGGATAAAQMLLGSRTDFGSLLGVRSETNSEKKKKKKSGGAAAESYYDPASRYSYDAMSGGGIEAVVRRHRDGILERVLKDQREQTRRLVEKAVDEKIERDLDEEREWWIRELVGDRNLADATRSRTTTTTTTEDPSSRGGGVGVGGASILVHSGNNNGGIGDNAMFASGCDPKAVKEHQAIVVGDLPRSSSSAAAVDPLGVVARFDQLARTGAYEMGYRSAWSILASMLRPRMRTPTPIDAARGVQAHFCKQYRTFIDNRVRSAGLSGQDASTPVRYPDSAAAAIVASYVKLESGSGASVWEILYYCLRCGDARAVQSVLNNTPAGEIEFSQQRLLAVVIQDLSARQGSAASMYEVGTPMIKAEDRLAILNAHETTQNLDPDNKHKLRVLALLGGKRPESFDTDTVEDYLFGNLWVALMDREDPIRQIEVIGASIRKYGPSHFAGDGSGEWGYVLPLIATQQFATALSYLSEAGGHTGLMQATHLGLVLTLAGVNVADLGDSSSSARGSTSQDIVTALLVNYAIVTESEPSAGVRASLEYLLRIPNPEESTHQVARLIQRSNPDQIDFLAGTLDVVGNRKNSLLDEKLPEGDVSAILITAAELTQKQSSDRPKAETSAKLFMLGNGHTKLIQLLNELISPVDVVDDDKNHWTQQAKLFYDAFLSKRTNVLESIEREGRSKLIDTNRSLLELRSFYEIYRRRSFEEAFGAVARTGLLPLSQQELNEKSSRFRDLDPILKRQFPKLLVAAVECLSELFHRLKSESRGLPPAVVDRLKELQFLARFLFAFAGLVNMPSACMTDIQQRRANMIV